MRRLFSTFLAAAALAGAAQADPWTLRGGLYEVAFRLELPHLERWAFTRTTLVCVPEADGMLAAPVAVLSENHPFAGCAATDLHRQGAELTYDLVCDGRAAARARASYTIGPETFSGRIAMTMGAKNMTMTEVQTGRRLSGCLQASARED